MNLSIETPAQENPDDARFRRCKDMILFFVGLVLLLGAFSFCAYVLLSHTFSADDEKWATAIASSIVTGFLAYITGKNVK
ncbi:MAG: hypothetical protein JSR33_11965 [Proteobacteria bacterium]|nr:hypothetical protein [Pseudomonadota bacterium]